MDIGQISREDLLGNMLRRERALRGYFYRWKTEYLRQKVVAGVENAERRVRVGDVVLLDTEVKREFWPLARIEDVREGRDGRVRSVLLRCKGKTYRRAINRLYFLESES